MLARTNATSTTQCCAGLSAPSQARARPKLCDAAAQRSLQLFIVLDGAGAAHPAPRHAVQLELRPPRHGSQGQQVYKYILPATQHVHSARRKCSSRARTRRRTAQGSLWFGFSHPPNFSRCSSGSGHAYAGGGNNARALCDAKPAPRNTSEARG